MSSTGTAPIIVVVWDAEGWPLGPGEEMAHELLGLAGWLLIDT